MSHTQHHRIYLIINNHIFNSDAHLGWVGLKKNRSIVTRSVLICLFWHHTSSSQQSDRHWAAQNSNSVWCGTGAATESSRCRYKMTDRRSRLQAPMESYSLPNLSRHICVQQFAGPVMQYFQILLSVLSAAILNEARRGRRQSGSRDKRLTTD